MPSSRPIGAYILLSFSLGLAVAFFLPSIIAQKTVPPYEHSLHFFETTLRPFLWAFPLALTLGIVFAITLSYSPRHGKPHYMVLSLFEWLSLMFPHHFALAFLAIAFGFQLYLSWDKALFFTYFTFLFSKTVVVFLHSFHKLKKYVYRAGISFGAGYIESLLRLVLPCVLPESLAKILKRAAFLLSDVFAAYVLLIIAQDNPNLPAAALLFQQGENANIMMKLTLFLVILLPQFFLWSLAALLSYWGRHNRYAYVQ
ncbi:MAG: hypothetical protein NZM25_08675 [Leptospiraceae bacterium]|nr:hypothetical protein [Leptospiraceae bacterium]MDW8306791.1 hypothetical protein [Leptospiraceae bacterium]